MTPQHPANAGGSSLQAANFSKKSSECIAQVALHQIDHRCQLAFGHRRGRLFTCFLIRQHFYCLENIISSKNCCSVSLFCIREQNPAHLIPAPWSSLWREVKYPRRAKLLPEPPLQKGAPCGNHYHCHLKDGQWASPSSLSPSPSSSSSSS